MPMKPAPLPSNRSFGMFTPIAWGLRLAGRDSGSNLKKTLNQPLTSWSNT